MKTVAVVGAGPAGLFAAYELARDANLRVIVFDQGKDALQRRRGDPFDLLHGMGGSGPFSDGKLNFHPQIGGDFSNLLGEDIALKLMTRIEQVFSHYDVQVISTDEEKTRELERKAVRAGIKFLPIRQAHVGSDHLVELIQRFGGDLVKSGVEFRLETWVEDVVIEETGLKGLMVGERLVEADFVLLAPGRVGCDWMRELAHKHSLGMVFNPLDVGVRVEVPAIVMEEVTRICYDPKFYFRTPSYDDLVRTFCVSPQGFVVTETYPDYVCVNGHAFKERKSANTNFALLVSVNLTEPVEDTIAYGISVAGMGTTLGKRKPIVQRLGDLRRYRRSTWGRLQKSSVDVEPTLKDVTPGDIAMALPHRVFTDILEALDLLEKVIPGVGGDPTLLYAPEIKWYGTRYKTDRSFQTEIPGLFVAGDGAGISRGIVGAAATGIIAARGIISAAKI